MQELEAMAAVVAQLATVLTGATVLIEAATPPAAVTGAERPGAVPLPKVEEAQP